MNQESKELLIKIICVGLTAFFIAVILTKRFLYFYPSKDLIHYLSINPINPMKPLNPINPMKPMNQDAYSMKYDDIYEGNLHAWYKKGQTGIVVLFCHGNGGNLSHRREKLYQLISMGHSVLIFDYNGYGKSSGAPNEELCYSSASTFVEYLLKLGYPKNKIVLYGESLGGAVASYTAKRYNLNKLILESFLPGVQILLKNKNKLLGILGLLFFNDFNSIEYLKTYQGKVLVIHSVEDEIIPYSCITENVIENQNRKIITTTGGHNDLIIPWNEINNFITE